MTYVISIYKVANLLFVLYVDIINSIHATYYVFAFFVQVVANAGNDHLTIAVAQEIEKAFGGWQQPPMTELNI